MVDVSRRAPDDGVNRTLGFTRSDGAEALHQDVVIGVLNCTALPGLGPDSSRGRAGR